MIKFKNDKKIIFFGSSEYSLYPLEKLHQEGYEILAVVTTPDQPVGRKQEITPTLVKKWAEEHNIPVLTAASKKELEEKISSFVNQPSSSRLRSNSKIYYSSSLPRRGGAISEKSNENGNTVDFFVVCVFGIIIPSSVLAIPKYGSINIHPSLLPKYRGSSPVQGALLNGEPESGVSIILMDEKMDHGPILAYVKEKILATDTAESLYKKLFEIGTNLLVEVLPKIINKNIQPKVQDDDKASFTKILKREDGKINWSWDNEKIERFVRAMGRWPGAHTGIKCKVPQIIFKEDFRGKQSAKCKVLRLKILETHIENNKLIIDRVQLEGKKPVGWKQFKEGYPEAEIIL